MGMTMLLAICILLVIGSLIMTLIAMAKMELLKAQNEHMAQEMGLLKNDYQKLILAWGGPSKSKNPAPQSSPSPAKEHPNTQEDGLLENAYKFQALLESYAEDHKGLYPDSLHTFENHVNSEEMNYYVNHPFTQEEVLLVSEAHCLDITVKPINEGIPENQGFLLYQANPDTENQISNYTLAAFDEMGLLLKRNGEVFTLSKVTD